MAGAAATRKGVDALSREGTELPEFGSGTQAQEGDQLLQPGERSDQPDQPKTASSKAPLDADSLIHNGKTLKQHLREFRIHLAGLAQSIFLILRQVSLIGINAFFMFLNWKIFFVAKIWPVFSALFLIVGVVDLLNIFYEVYLFFWVTKKKEDFNKNFYGNWLKFIVAVVRSALVLTACIGTVFFHTAFLLVTSKLFLSAMILGAVYFAIESYWQYREEKRGKPLLTLREFCRTNGAFQQFILCSLLAPTVALVFAFPPGGIITAIAAGSACLFILVSSVLIAITRTKTSLEGMSKSQSSISQILQQRIQKRSESLPDLGYRPAHGAGGVHGSSSLPNLHQDVGDKKGDGVAVEGSVPLGETGAGGGKPPEILLVVGGLGSSSR